MRGLNHFLLLPFLSYFLFSIVRCVETTGAAQQVHLALHLLGRDLMLSFTPFEIKTLYLPDDPAQSAREIPLTELE